MTHERTPDSDVEQLIRAAGSRLVPDADRTARVRASVEREWRAYRRARRMWRWTGVTVALVIAAATAFFGVRPRLLIAPPAKPAAPAHVATVAAAHGAVTMELAAGRTAVAAVGQTIAAGSNIRTNSTSRTTVTLVDGGELRIDTNTVATLVDARTIQLERGTIYLDSGVSTPGSFTVRTASGIVRDIGTRFEIRASLLRQGFGGQALPALANEDVFILWRLTHHHGQSFDPTERPLVHRGKF